MQLYVTAATVGVLVAGVMSKLKAGEVYTIFEGTSETQQLVIARAISGLL